MNTVGPPYPLIVYIVTSSVSYRLLKGQLNYVQSHGYRVALIVGDQPPELWQEAELLALDSVIVIPMVRAISPFRDLIGIFRLWRALRRLCPVITNVSTPKAGLLGGIAAFLAGVPCRIYTLRGLRYATAKGGQKALLRALERLACFIAHHVIAVSKGLREVAVCEKLRRADKILFLANGSSNGVDVDLFDSQAIPSEEVARLRQKLQIPAHAPVIGFVGRLTRDKGVPELLDAFEAVQRDIGDLRLLVVGRFESGDAVDPAIRSRIESHPQIVHCGFVTDTRAHYQLMDILVLPTYREGFSNVSIEAQAAGRPVVTTKATGAIDSIIDGVTGIAVSVGNVAELTGALRVLIVDRDLRQRMGKAGQSWVRAHYRQEIVWNALLDLYRQLVAPVS